MKYLNAKGIVIALAAFMLVIMLFSVFLNETPESDYRPPSTNQEQQEPKRKVLFNQVGYTKGPDRYRLFVYWVVADSTMEMNSIRPHLRRHASDRMHTSGRSTTVYYYLEDHPPERTFRTTKRHRDFLAQYDPPQAVYMILPNGTLQAL